MNDTTMNFEATEESSLGSLLPHLLTIIRQRKWLLIVPALAGLLLGVAAAYLLPVTYQSRAVLLVEAPALPDNLALDVTGFEVIDQRMARIRQQLLSRQQLVEIIQRNGLYSTEFKIRTLSEVMDDMRDAIRISPVTANIQSGGGRNTIAFSMSFDYSDPIKAQSVVQTLTDQVLQINAATQSQQAQNTVQFLTDRANDLLGQIKTLEDSIMAIKANNGMTLSGMNSSLAGSGVAYDAQITSLQQSIAGLRSQRQLIETSPNRDSEVMQAQSQLAQLTAIYTDQHPDVILAKQRLDEARRLATTRVQEFPLDRAKVLDEQIVLQERQLNVLRQARAASANAVVAQQQQPVLMEQLGQLQVRLSDLNGQYSQISSQLNSAQAGKRAEDEQQGERLSLMEAPSAPDRPISPNRPLLIFAGFALGLGFGLFLILALEFIYRPIRHVDTVSRVLGERPLVVIPTIYAPGERQDGLLAKLWPGGGDDDDD